MVVDQSGVEVHLSFKIYIHIEARTWFQRDGHGGGEVR